MKFTFGIITGGNEEKELEYIIKSIRSLEIEQNDYEIIIVGPTASGFNTVDALHGDLKRINFDVNQRKGWITRQKNIITENAIFDNIVYLHGYISFDLNWYEGMKQFGNDWDICMTNIINKDGTRYRDWIYWDHPEYCYPAELPDFPLGKHRIKFPPENIVPECDKQYMYISGAYWIAKKTLMQKFPLDEGLCWGQGEDLRWSKQVLYNGAKYVFNDNSSVHLLKQKETVATEV